MDNNFKVILDSLPPPEPRSCLDPFRKLIEELHRRGRTYREISTILTERCEVSVSASTVYRFLHRRSRIKSQSHKRELSPVPKMKKGYRQAVTEEKVSVVSETETITDEIQRRISALKHRQTPDQTKSKLFHYDPDEPLHLPEKPNRNKDQ